MEVAVAVITSINQQFMVMNGAVANVNGPLADAAYNGSQAELSYTALLLLYV